MVTENTGTMSYDLLDTGLKIFISILMLMVVIWCIFQIVKYCKIIKENFTATHAEKDEFAEIRNNVNNALSKIKSERDAK